MKKSSTIRALENKARKDDINALFQLAKYYEEGKNVDKDLEQAEVYFARVLTLFQAQSLQISSLKLADFRGFESILIDFTNKESSNLTVIIGNNGAGKTSLLDAIKKSLSWVIKNMLNQSSSGTGELIEELDINNSSEAGYASIVTNFSVVSGFDCQLELSKTRKNVKSTQKGFYQEITQLAEIYKLANFRDTQFNFPIMAYYSIERADEINKKYTKQVNKLSKQNNRWNKFDGYDRALNGAADFEFFFSWFKYLEDCNNASVKQNQKPLIEITKLQAELDILKKLGKHKHADLENKSHESVIAFKNQIQEDLSRLQEQIKQDPASKAITIVTQVISEFLPEFNNLRIQYPSLDMMIDKNGIPLNIRQLSQGEKSLLALVADIARRLVLLNPSDDPLQGKGIVLIDEIDLHLHPKWQQTVIPGLLRVFPNVQFIITTHSPPVATTVDDECIRILRDGKVYSAPKGSRGAKSSRLLKRLFEVEVRPPNDSNSIDLAEYKKFVYSDNWECIQAQELRKKLDQQFGGEEPDLTELDLYIENRIWEIELEKDQ